MTRPDRTRLSLPLPTTSRLIPAFSGNTVLWGHWAMSVDFQERLNWLTDLFSQHSSSDDQRKSHLFWKSGIRYILVDGALREWLEKYPAAWQSILMDADKVFANDSLVIYERKKGIKKKEVP